MIYLRFILGLFPVMLAPIAGSAPAPVEPKTEAPIWRVETPSGGSKAVAIDTTEGTSMNLDVIPDSRGVVFEAATPAANTATDADEASGD